MSRRPDDLRPWVTPLRRHLRPRRQWNEEGVASTVGTIMALLVFLTFLSLITNQYVPVWMKDSESGHMGEALGQMGNFKAAIDVQVLSAQTVAAVGRHYIPVTTFATIKLGVDGVPIFSTSTVGRLTVDQAQAPWTVWFRYSISGNNTTVPEWNCLGSLPASPVACGASGGSVVLSVFNRYFPQQSIAYENGALIRSQSDGQVVKAEPSFQVLVTNTSAQVDFTLIQMFGNGGLTGVGSEGLQARVIGVDLEEYANIKTDIYVLHNTTYGPAWYNFVNDTLASAYGIKSSDYKRAGFTYTETYDANRRATQLRVDNPIYVVQSLWDPAKQWYRITLQFKTPGMRNGVNVLPVSAFRLQHAYANVAAGEQGNSVGI